MVGIQAQRVGGVSLSLSFFLSSFVDQAGITYSYTGRLAYPMTETSIHAKNFFMFFSARLFHRHRFPSSSLFHSLTPSLFTFFYHPQLTNTQHTTHNTQHTHLTASI